MLLAAVVVVVWVLPDLVEPPAEVAEPDPRAPAPVDKPAAPSAQQLQLARDKREAERALQQLLERQTVLEAQQVSVWGGADYEAVLARLAEGDARFTAEEFAAAAAVYRDVGAMLQALEVSRQQRLTAALASGAQALESYDAESARKQFAIALAIDPHHEDAQRGAARAVTLDRLAALLAAARDHERNGDWTQAAEQYRAAQQLDPDADEAREGAARVAATVEQLEFRAAMSQALAALETGALSTARSALQRAYKLDPKSQQVADAQRRLTDKIQAHTIAQHRAQAQQGERDERWQEVIGAYRAVLAIDARAQFALQGLQRAERFAELHGQLDAYLAAPQRLQSSQPRANADRLLQSASSLTGKGPQLRRKLDALEELVNRAGTPVAVLIRSDNQTEVSIDRVGRFGRFEESRMRLLPGTYRVRGTRAGYRDVYLKWTVKAGAALQTIEVRCKERI